MVENVVDDSLDLAFERRIVEKERERHHAVQPVGHPLPTLGFSTDPGAVLDVGPEFIEMAAEARGLDLELVAKPAGRLDLPQGQGLKHRSIESRTLRFCRLTGTGLRHQVSRDEVHRNNGGRQSEKASHEVKSSV